MIFCMCGINGARMLEPHIRNPNESVKLRILELAHQGRSNEDICKILDKTYDPYRPFVSRVIAEYRGRGVLTAKIDTE